MNLIKKLYHNDIVRYIFFGGCTTLVNLVTFYLLRKIEISLNIANFISIVAAILFAYVVNSRFVFEKKAESFQEQLQMFCKFIGARVATMLIELLSVWLLVTVLGMNDLLGKFITQFIVLVLNYIFSKFFVFS